MTGKKTVKTKYEELKLTLEEALEKGDKLAIELHKIPDPDAMAAGLFIYELTKAMGYKPTITHQGRLSHPQNIVMARKLDIPLNCYGINGEESLNPENFDSFIYVDHSGSNSYWHSEGKIPEDKLIGIIDHHELSEKHSDNLFIDKRKVGAVSSILAEYLKDGAQEEYFAEEEKLKKISSALFLGIRSDTRTLKRDVDILDSTMHAYLWDHVDMNLVDGIEDLDWSTEWFDRYGRAINQRKSKNGVTVASVGYIEAEERDVIPIVADQLIRERSIQTVYVFGIRPDVIDFSIRTRDPTYIFETLKEVFEPLSAGGREGTGGMQLTNPFTGFFSPDSKTEKTTNESIIRAKIEKTIFHEEDKE
ncbi:hypothetical protein COV11_03470 [Candidatus Woesearchaeota archaeon CG10_big_fil_rev_8_21_14_0_10_30_7]|nr:MAG: hypothetical protein COV11_03470 [Candidatus Woesearchaeota archaeon CG10_big_fil_rev_8_21_14_0_10_30_7]